jgi:hypothetical protein
VGPSRRGLGGTDITSGWGTSDLQLMLSAQPFVTRNGALHIVAKDFRAYHIDPAVSSSYRERVAGQTHWSVLVRRRG